MLGLQRFSAGFATQLFRRATYGAASRASSSVAAAAATPSSQQPDNNKQAEKKPEIPSSKPKSNMVAAAFESLKNENTAAAGSKNGGGGANIDERIINAKTVNGLLAITENNVQVSRKHALKIVSILADWSSMNRIKLTEFENDSRFLRLCRMLGRTVPKSNSNAKEQAYADNRISGFRTDDLNTVLGVAGDDEAAKLIASISVPQMVKVMSTLAQRKRRSTPLLRSLAFNISSSSEQLDLKQCADVFYAMATLSFQDSVLSAKLCADIQAGLPKNKDKSAVVGSMLTSLGILKYRDLDVMESLTEWTLQNSEICRPQDVSALFYTSAVLSFKSANLEDMRQKLVKSIVMDDFIKPIDWLNHVWALSMLGLAEHNQLESVLSNDFLLKMQSSKSQLTPTSKMKLLNLNSYAQLCVAGYKDVVLPADSPIFNVPMAHGKSKQTLVNGMLDALKNLLPANNHVNSLVDSKMGFLIDALCLFDAKLNPLPMDNKQPNAIKVALMVVDFHDICHGPHRAASGITSFTYELLEKSGYTVVTVPYNEFNTSDKLLKRVQYLEAKFKAIISSKN